MKLRECVKKHVEVIHAAAPLQEAARRMRTSAVGFLPVVEDDRIVGAITDRDIAIRAVSEGWDPARTAVRRALTPGVVFGYEDQDVREAARIMEEREVRRLVVLDGAGQLVGVVSLGDIALDCGGPSLAGEVLGRLARRPEASPA